MGAREKAVNSLYKSFVRVPWKISTPFWL